MKERGNSCDKTYGENFLFHATKLVVQRTRALLSLLPTMDPRYPSTAVQEIIISLSSLRRIPSSLPCRFVPNSIAFTGIDLSCKNIAGKDLTTMANPSRNFRSRSTRVAKTPLKATEARHKVIHDYHDHAEAVYQLDGDDARNANRGGVAVPFPIKLHVMLSKTEENGLSHIISWYVP